MISGGSSMISMPTFDALLDAISKLSPDEQDDLVNVIRRRLAALRRQEIIAEVLQAEAELHQAGTTPRPANEVMRDITS
jgi:hypothetical protein